MAALSEADHARLEAGAPALVVDTSRFTPDPNSATAGIPEPEKPEATAGEPAPAKDASAAPAAEKPAAAPDPMKIEKAQPAPAESLDYVALSKELADNGGLTPESRAAIAAAYPHMPPQMVDAYIEGQLAIIERTRSAGFQIAGGEENYKAMASWASKNLSQEELDAYNQAVDSANATPASRKMAIQGLRAQYEATREPSLARRETANAPSGAGAINNREQRDAAMRDPRYKTDPEYRRDVQRRLADAIHSGRYTA